MSKVITWRGQTRPLYEWLRDLARRSIHDEPSRNDLLRAIYDQLESTTETAPKPSAAAIEANVARLAVRLQEADHEARNRDRPWYSRPPQEWETQAAWLLAHGVILTQGDEQAMGQDRRGKPGSARESSTGLSVAGNSAASDPSRKVASHTHSLSSSGSGEPNVPDLSELERLLTSYQLTGNDVRDIRRGSKEAVAARAAVLAEVRRLLAQRTA